LLTCGNSGVKRACCRFQIDLQTFLTLTDQDLKELGITTFGARRKMLLAISGTREEKHVLFSEHFVFHAFPPSPVFLCDHLSGKTEIDQ